jgi:hypothetical protein
VLARWFMNALGALTLALLTVGHVLPVLHFTLVAHELCAEHGALHHVDGKESASSSHRSPARGQAALPAANAQHEHEHCSVIATAAERALVPAAPEFSSVFVASRSELSAPAARMAHRNVALLAYAPKLAPPV